MFERFKRKNDRHEERGGVATAERERTTTAADREATGPRFGRDRVGDAETAREVRARQREEFGGIN
jgi:hypothetical protein